MACNCSGSNLASGKTSLPRCAIPSSDSTYCVEQVETHPNINVIWNTALGGGCYPEKGKIVSLSLYPNEKEITVDVPAYFIFVCVITQNC